MSPERVQEYGYERPPRFANWLSKPLLRRLPPTLIFASAEPLRRGEPQFGQRLFRRCMHALAFAWGECEDQVGSESSPTGGLAM
jgi:hypothetical protein